MRYFLAVITGAALSLMGLLPVAQAESQIETGFFADADSGSTLVLFPSDDGAIAIAPDLFFAWGGDLYTDPATQTTANARIGSAGPTPFKRFDWVTHHVRLFGPGNYSFDADCTAEQIEAGIVDCPVIQPVSGSNFPEGRILTLNVGPGQIGAHLLGDWNQSKDIGVVQLWDINTAFAGSPDEASAGNDLKGVFFTLVSVDTDNDGIPGGRMLTGPLTGSSVSFNFNLTATFPLTNSQDADSDGIPDDQDVIDNLVITTQQQGLALEGGNFLLESSAGTLVLGDIAAAAAISSGIYQASVDADTLGVVDATVDRACLGSCFSFTVTGLSPETVVDVVLPLSEAIPVNAVVRKLIGGAWADFDSSGADAIMSAPGSAGSCPGVIDSGWTADASVGDFCLKLTLTEGGVNDADGIVNGVIKDPTGVAVAKNTDNADNNSDVASNSDSGSGGGCTINTQLNFDPVWIVSVLLLWLLGHLAQRREQEQR